MSIPTINTAPAMAIATPQLSATRSDAGTRPLSTQAVEQSANAAPASDAVRSVRDAEQPQPASPTDLQQALKEVQTAINSVANDLRFSIDEDTGRTLVKIVDRETDEVIKQIPSEELLRIAKALDKFQGLLVKQAV